MNKLQIQNFITETDTVSLQTLYFSQDNIVINANINYLGTFSSSDERCLLIVDNEFNTIGTISGVPINWYSQDKNNFSGFQVVIPPSISNTLTTNVNYNLYVQFTLNGETLELPLENPLDIGLIHNSDFSIGQNSNTSIYIEKLTTSTKPVIINSGTATIIDGYWINSGYVLDIEITLDDTIASTDPINLVSKNSLISITGTNVSWYSSNKSTYNGVQIIITPDTIVKITSIEQLFINVIIGSITYSMPLKYSINSNFETINNIQYSLSTQNNNISLNKENILN